jgi:hypothetical protein
LLTSIFFPLGLFSFSFSISFCWLSLSLIAFQLAWLLHSMLHTPQLSFIPLYPWTIFFFFRIFFSVFLYIFPSLSSSLSLFHLSHHPHILICPLNLSFGFISFLSLLRCSFLSLFFLSVLFSSQVAFILLFFY